MDNKSTHALTITVGLDLTKILNPASITGVMAYLGVEHESDLLEAVAIDQNKRATEALEKLGFTILSSKFESLVKSGAEEDQREEKPNAEVTQISNPEGESTESTAPLSRPQDNDQVNQMMDGLMNNIQKIQMDEGEIQEIAISKELESNGPSIKEIRTVTDLSEDVDIVYVAVEAGELAMISYVDKNGELEFKSIKEEVND